MNHAHAYSPPDSWEETADEAMRAEEEQEETMEGGVRWRTGRKGWRGGGTRRWVRPGEAYSASRTNLKRGIRRAEYSHELRTEEQQIWPLTHMARHPGRLQTLQHHPPTSNASSPDELNRFYACFCRDNKEAATKICLTNETGRENQLTPSRPKHDGTETSTSDRTRTEQELSKCLIVCVHVREQVRERARERERNPSATRE